VRPILRIEKKYSHCFVCLQTNGLIYIFLSILLDYKWVNKDIVAIYGQAFYKHKLDETAIEFDFNNKQDVNEQSVNRNEIKDNATAKTALVCLILGFEI
jgi:hypothetical protein